MYKCKLCEKEFEEKYSKWSDGNFCCKEHARSYSTLSKRDEINKKVSKTLTGSKSKLLKTYNQRCVICGSSFTYTGIRNKRLCCSDLCVNRQKRIAGKKSASIRKLRSKDEKKLFELCKIYFNNVKHNEIIRDGWDADIILLDYKTLVFWNGPWHYKEMGIKGVSLKQIKNRDNIKKKLFEDLGWNVVVFEDRYYTPESAMTYIIESLLDQNHNK